MTGSCKCHLSMSSSSAAMAAHSGALKVSIACLAAGAVWLGLTLALNLCDESEVAHHIQQLSIDQQLRTAVGSPWHAHDTYLPGFLLHE